MNEPRRKQRPISQLLEDPNRGINKTHGAWGLLSKLFRLMLFQNKINGYRYYMLMDRFLKDPRNRSKKGEGEYSDNRGNLNKEFSNPMMSWKVFCKGARFQQGVKMRVTVELEHKNGVITTHKAMVDLENDVIMNNPLFQAEIEALEKEAQVNPDQPYLPAPEDQPNIPMLDKDPNDPEWNE